MDVFSCTVLPIGSLILFLLLYIDKAVVSYDRHVTSFYIVPVKNIVSVEKG